MTRTHITNMNSTEAKQSNAQTNWHWQFDPLDDSGRVQIANGDVILAEVASIKSANYVTHRLNNHDALVAALEGMLECYTSLVNSGDAGNWNPETDDEVIAASAALKQAKEVQP